MRSILIYGGSFDPPHLGHLTIALNTQQHCGFNKVCFLPCQSPVLKQPTLANAHHRLKMLELMLADYPQFEISTLEMDRDTPSYMAETLKELRQHYGERDSITLLLGMDAFQNLPQWFHSETLPTLCNVLIIQRLSSTINSASVIAASHLFPKQCTDARDLKNETSGAIAFYDAGNIPISSTAIRDKLRSGGDVTNMLPAKVMDYVKAEGLYR